MLDTYLIITDHGTATEHDYRTELGTRADVGGALEAYNRLPWHLDFGSPPVVQLIIDRPTDEWPGLFAIMPTVSRMAERVGGWNGRVHWRMPDGSTTSTYISLPE